MTDEEAFPFIYRKCLKYVNYVPANGYVWIDYREDWHGPYETEDDAVKAFMKYLLDSSPNGLTYHAYLKSLDDL